MKVAVTGGTGFIGRRVVRLLRERGHDVTCLVRTPDKAGELSALGATLRKADILDADSLRAGFAGAEGILHIAASYELGVVGKRAADALRRNLEGTRLALEAARDAGAQKIVYTSSTVIYGNTGAEVVPEGWRPPRIEFPSTHATFYGMSKARAHYEIALPMIDAGAPIVIVQPGGVIGPRDHSTLRALWRFLATGLPVPVGRGSFPVVDVEDTALGHVLALERGRVGASYHLTDENLTLPELLARAMAASGLRTPVIVLPDWLLRVNAALTSLVERVLPVPDILSSDATRAMLASMSIRVDSTRTRRELGWTPRPLDEVLRGILADERQRRGKPLPPQLEGVRPRLS
jgi:nucleoside-diphosphate-sugar epimerase